MSSIFNEQTPILYELLVYEEWVQDPECVNNRNSTASISKLPLSPQKFISYIRSADWPSEELLNELSHHLPWRIALSPNGLMVAVLQDGLLEVRSDSDDFTSVVGKATVPKDLYPQLRILKWHPENNKIAISSSSGVVTIYDSFCNHLHTIPQPRLNDREESQKVFVAGIEFIEIEKGNRGEEAVVIYSNGVIKSVILSEKETFQEISCSQLDVQKVSCAVYNKHYSILFISSQPQPTTKLFQDTCMSAGLSAWRLVSDKQCFKRLFPSEEEFKLFSAGGKLWKMFNFTKAQGVAIKLAVSQNNQFLASLHSCNTIIIWLIPSLRLHRKWTMLDTDINRLDGFTVDQAPVDIDWRHDERLIVSRRDGSISVHHIETFEVCYGSGSELLNGHPRISSTKNFPGFISLECDTILLSPSSEDSSYDGDKSILNSSSEIIQNTIYYITDIDTFQPKKKLMKVIQKIYRMIGVKSTTPEELFRRKLDNNEYSGALELAVEFGLNSDDVYKKLWRSSSVSSASIYDNLSKIQNISWILDECVRRVPESVAGAEDLFQFALNLTAFTNTFPELPNDKMNSFIDKSFSIDEISTLQKEKLITRATILNYADKLRVYKAILGGDPDKDGTYDMNHYDKFRKLPIVESAVYFARQCNIGAIEIIFNYYTSQVTPFWLCILENIPEIFSPHMYSKLLPQCDGEKRPVAWQTAFHRERDWIEKKAFRSQITCLIEDITMKDLESHDTLTSPLLTQWYRKRTLDIEYQSKIVSHSLTIVQLAIERNIEGLDDLHSNFITLECMVYELELDIDMSTLLNMTDLQKCIKLFEKVIPENFTQAMLNYFSPFLNRQHIENEKRSQLYLDFLSHISRTSLKSSLLFIKYLLDGETQLLGGPEEIVTLIIECVYSYTLLDMATETLSIIDTCLPWIKSLNAIRDRRGLLRKLHQLREETLAAQILADYFIPVSIKAIHSFKSDDNGALQIIERMTSTVIKEYMKNRNNTAMFDKCMQDILSLQQICFVNIHLDDCNEMYASALLNSQCLSLIELANSVICSKKENETSSHLTFECSVALILKAAQRYFDISENVDDEVMDLAKACLFLIKDDHPDKNTELDLIQALKYLNEVGVNLIPVQVRQSDDRMKLLHLCFEKNIKLYRKPQFVYKLGATLRVHQDNILQRHNVITNKMAEVSFEDDADSICIEFCHDLIINSYAEGWEIIFKILKKGVIEDPFTRKLFWCFCSIHAPSRLLVELMSLRHTNVTTTASTPYDYIGTSEHASYSLANTPDSEDLDDYHLASSDSSHKLDEPSDAEPMPSFCCPYFYLTETTGQDTQWPDYRLTKISYGRHPFFHMIQCSSEESLFSFIEAHKFQVEPWIIDSRLIELYRKYCNKDTLLGLGFLLNTSNPSSCEDFFDNLPQVPFTQELGVYYYSHCALRDQQQYKLKPPFQAASLACSMEHNQFKSLIMKYSKKWESLMQAKSLQEEDCGVNYERFMEDESYKLDTIFGLAMSSEKLGIAFELAKKNNIPLEEIAITHAEALFLDGNIESIIKHDCGNGELASLLKSSSDAVISRFQSRFDIIDGKDYKKLSNYFKIINYVDGDHAINDLTSKEHIKLLKRVESTVPGLDYKELISKKENLIDLLQPFLEQSDTVANCVKFVKSLPKSLKSDVSTSLLYYQYSINQFGTLYQHCYSLRQYASNFEAIYPSLAKLAKNDLLAFIQSSICSNEAIRKLDYVTRRQLLNSLLHWCDDTNYMRGDMESITEYIQDKLEKLNNVWNDDDDILLNPHLRGCLSEIEICCSTSDENSVNNIQSVLTNNSQNITLSQAELHALKRATSLLNMQDLIDDIYPNNSIPIQSNEVLNNRPRKDSTVNNTDEIDKLSVIKSYCDKVIVNNSETLQYESPDGSGVLSDAKFTSSMLKYMFTSDNYHSTADSTNKIMGDFISKYEVATIIIKENPPSYFFQKCIENVTKCLNDDNADKVFLLWLCLTCKPLNLHDMGESLLNDIETERLVAYLRNHIDSQEYVIPILTTTSKYAHIIASILGDGEPSILQNFVNILYKSGMVAEAGTLRMQVMRLPCNLKSFAASLNTFVNGPGGPSHE